MRADEWNTIAAREAQFGVLRAPIWWLDDELDVIGRYDGSTVTLPPGTLPNRTFAAPFDWPRPGMLLRYPRAVRILVADRQNLGDVFYPGDPKLTEITDPGGFAHQDHILADRVMNTIAPAVEASLAGTGILFALHQAWHVGTVFAGGLPRFLRPLAPPDPAGFFGLDLLEVVLLVESGSESWFDFVTGDPLTAYFNWNYSGYQPGIDTRIYNETDGSIVHSGMNAAFAVDAARIVAAHDGFPRHRVVLYTGDPGDQGIVPGANAAGDAVLADLAVARSNNALEFAEIAAALAPHGVEYGGDFDPLADDGSGLVALVADHFDL
jgi:hypothetical protein